MKRFVEGSDRGQSTLRAGSLGGLPFRSFALDHLHERQKTLFVINIRSPRLPRRYTLALSRGLENALSRIRNAALAFAGAVLATSAASAASPVALIEELSGNPAGLEVMDYLEMGRIIRLGARETLVLSYLNS